MQEDDDGGSAQPGGLRNAPLSNVCFANVGVHLLHGAPRTITALVSALAAVDPSRPAEPQGQPPGLWRWLSRWASGPAPPAAPSIASELHAVLRDVAAGKRAADVRPLLRALLSHHGLRASDVLGEHQDAAEAVEVR